MGQLMFITFFWAPHSRPHCLLARPLCLCQAGQMRHLYMCSLTTGSVKSSLLAYSLGLGPGRLIQGCNGVLVLRL